MKHACSCGNPGKVKCGDVCYCWVHYMELRGYDFNRRFPGGVKDETIIEKGKNGKDKNS